MHECVRRTVVKTVPPRTSVPLPYLSFIHGWNFQILRTCTTKVMLTASTQTHSLTCRRYEFIAVLTMNHFKQLIKTC